MTSSDRQKRDYRVHYVRCPDDYAHFILADTVAPPWEKNPPKSPVTLECRGCGPHYPVTVKQPWKIGFVSVDERDAGVSHSEPATTADA